MFFRLFLPALLFSVILCPKHLFLLCIGKDKTKTAQFDKIRFRITFYALHNCFNKNLIWLYLEKPWSGLRFSYLIFKFKCESDLTSISDENYEDEDQAFETSITESFFESIDNFEPITLMTISIKSSTSLKSVFTLFRLVRTSATSEQSNEKNQATCDK